MSLRLATTRSMGLMASEIARPMPKVSNRAIAKALLSGFLERLSWGGEYLGACIGNPASLKARHRLPQKQFRKVNSDIWSRWYGSANGQAIRPIQANSQAYNGSKTRPTCWVYGGPNKETWPTNWVHHHQKASEEVLGLSPTQSFPVFLLSNLTRLGGFSPITLQGSFGFLL